MKFNINWSEYLVAGNPRINREIGEKNTIRCVGYTPIEAQSKNAAVDTFLKAFPRAKIEFIN